MNIHRSLSSYWLRWPAVLIDLERQNRCCLHRDHPLRWSLRQRRETCLPASPGWLPARWNRNPASLQINQECQVVEFLVSQKYAGPPSRSPHSIRHPRSGKKLCRPPPQLLAERQAGRETQTVPQAPGRENDLRDSLQRRMAAQPRPLTMKPAQIVDRSNAHRP